MSSEVDATPKVRGSGTGWLVVLVVIISLISVGVVAWRRQPVVRFSPAASVSIAEYLTLKEGKRVREVWLDREELYAEVEPDFVRDGKSFRFIETIVPLPYLFDPKAFKELKSGLDPSRFTVIRK